MDWRRLPIQPSGWVVLAVGLASLIGAFLLSWRELLVLAVGCGVVLLLSVPFVLGRDQIDLTRVVVPDRVVVGDEAKADVLAANPTGLPIPSRLVTDSLEGEPVPVRLPPLGPNDTTTASWDLPTNRRGRYTIGPARITKSDPFRLMARDVGQTGIDHLWVHPETAILPNVLVGRTKDLDGPTSDQSPQGDVAFHAIRPYQSGDDARHVHWMATARAGELMVRQYVDNRQPSIGVLLDVGTESWSSDDAFEQAVSIAGSLALTALQAGDPITLFAGPDLLTAGAGRTSRQHVLDGLTLVQPLDDFELVTQAGPLLARDRDITSLFLVTGAERRDEVSMLALSLARTAGVTVLRVGSRAPSPARAATSAGIQTLDVASLDDLVRTLGPGR